MAISFFVEHEDIKAEQRFVEYNESHPQEDYDIDFILGNECSISKSKKSDISRIHNLLKESKEDGDLKYCLEFREAVRNSIFPEYTYSVIGMGLYWVFCMELFMPSKREIPNSLILLINIALLLEDTEQYLGGLHTKRCTIKNNKIVFKYEKPEELALIISNSVDEEEQAKAEHDVVNLGLNPKLFLTETQYTEILNGSSGYTSVFPAT